MKWLNKLLFLFIFTFLFVGSDKVSAATYLTTNNTEIECVYANGVVIGLRTSDNSQPTVYIKDYPISPTVTIVDDISSQKNIVDSAGAIGELSDFTCPSYVKLWHLKSKNDEELASVKSFYNFSYQYNGDTVSSYLLKPEQVWWWSEATNDILPIESPELGTTDDYEECDGHCVPELDIPIVGERVYIVGDHNDIIYYLTYKNSAAQASGKNQYIQILKIDTNNNYLIKKGNVITSFSGDVDAVINADDYLCFKESYITSDANRTDSGYKFSSVRHDISRWKWTGSCPTGYVKYERTTATCTPQSGDGAESFCDRYSNTAFVLAKIISAMQLIVPLLVIVITGIEIFRLVASGDLVEELPKRKKLILIRFIVMIFFFFLPLLTKIIISQVEGVSILDVGCLFGEAYEGTVGDDENCVEVSS